MRGAALAACLAAASLGANCLAAGPSQELARTLDDVPRGLDPQLVADLPAQHVLDDLFEGLVSVGIDGRPAPGVARSWDTSADGLTWTFHLRPDARWSNGEALGAEDFVYSWRREVDPATGAVYAQTLSPIAHALDIARGRAPTSALGVTASDAHTLVVQLTAPTPYLLDLLDQFYLYPVYRAAVERYGADWTRPEHLVSNGAFVLRENVLGNRLTLERNGDYWDAAHVQLKSVRYYPLPDRAQSLARYQADEVQYTDSFPIGQEPYLARTLGGQMVVSPWLGTYELGLDLSRPPFAGNRALREALALAIDRGALTHYLKYDLYRPAYTLSPAMPGFAPPTPAWSTLPTAQREALARQRYAQAGYSGTRPLHLTFSVPAQGAEERHFYEAVTSMWRSVLGADVRIDQLEFKVLWQQRSAHALTLFYNSWLADFADPINFLQRYRSGNPLNYGLYSNPHYDALLDQAAAARDANKRLQLLAQAETLLQEDVPDIPLYYYATRHLVKPQLRGWQPNMVDRNLSRYMYFASP